ncbi:MAG: tetratricopeptide repeat protein [Pseudomonadota bacterium]
MPGQTVEIFGYAVPLYQLLLLTAAVGTAFGLALADFSKGRAGKKDDEKRNLAAAKERAASNAAFMKGVNYILADQPDRAIEELTKAVEVDTETVETYVALGNLFRSKGETDRAIRIRQSIMFRPKLDPRIRMQAQYDLGLDYRRGGFFERAAASFEELLRQDPKRADALTELVRIYEETRDWDKASAALTRLAKVTGRKVNNILAHHQVEIGQAYFEKGLLPQAKSAYKRALVLDPGCLDAHLHLGDLRARQGQIKKATAAWRKAIEAAPDRAYLVFNRLARAAVDMKEVSPLMDFLSELAQSHRGPLARLALGGLMVQGGQVDQAVEEFKKAISLDPGLIEARRRLGLLLLSLDRKDEALEACRELLAALGDPTPVFQCGKCGLESAEPRWRCPQCQSWDSVALKDQNRPTPREESPSFNARKFEERTSGDSTL